MTLALAACLLLASCGDVDRYGLPRSLPHEQLGYIDWESSMRLMSWLDAEESAGAAEVVMYINSTGGEVNPGFALIGRMDTATPTIYCVVDYEALSMAFEILQSCDVRIMTTRSLLMAHESSPVDEDSPYVNEALAVQATRRMNVTLDYYKGRIANGRKWWMSPEEALTVGAVDRLVFVVGL